MYAITRRFSWKFSDTRCDWEYSMSGGLIDATFIVLLPEALPGNYEQKFFLEIYWYPVWLKIQYVRRTNICINYYAITRSFTWELKPEDFPGNLVIPGVIENTVRPEDYYMHYLLCYHQKIYLGIRRYSSSWIRSWLHIRIVTWGFGLVMTILWIGITKP